MQKKSGFRFIPLPLKARYRLDDHVPSSQVYTCSVCEDYTAFKRGETFHGCEACISTREGNNYWYPTNSFVHFISKNLNLEFDEFLSFHLRLADRITEAVGTLWFLYLHILWFVFWIKINTGAMGGQSVFDPYPFGLLTMIVSLEAIFLSIFIMISQNIATKRTELRAEHEYQVNLNTEKNVAEIHTMVKELHEELEQMRNEQKIKKRSRKHAG